MGVVKNLMVRVGADLSGLVSGFNKAGGATGNFKQKAAKDITSLKSSLSQMRDAYTSISEAAKDIDLTKSVSKQITETNKELGSLEKTAQDLENKLAFWSEIEPAGMQCKTQELREALGSVDGQIDSLYYKLQRLENVKSLGESVGIDNVTYSSLNKLQMNITSVEDELRRAEDAAEDTSDATRDLGNSAKSAGSKVKTASSWIGGLRKNAKASALSVSDLTRSLRRIGVVAVGVKLAGAVLGKFRSLVTGYISQNETLQAKVDELKAGFGQALAPAINLATNALSKMMPYILGVSNAIGELITNLFGTGWTTVAEGAAAAASATGIATDAQNEYNRTLAGFDKITKLSSSKDDGSAGSSTAAAKVTLPSWITDLPQTLKDAFSTDGFKGVGETLSMALSEGLQQANKSDGSLGKTVAKVIQGAIDGAAGFVENLDYEELGTSIDTFFSDLFGGIDWGTLSSTIGSAVGGIGTTIWTAISDDITATRDYFDDEIEAAGGNVILGIWNGITKAVENVGTWIKDNIFTPFVDGFKKTFNIHSPSKAEEIVSLGSNIIAGIYNGIVDKLKSVGTWIEDNVYTPVVEAFENVFGKEGFFANLLKGTMKDSGNLSVDFKANLTSWKDKLTDKAVSFKANLASWKDKLTDKAVSFKANLTSWKDKLTDKAVSFKANLASWKDKLTDKAVSFKANLTSWKDKLTDKAVSFKANLASWKDKLTDKAVSFKANLTSWNDKLTDKAVSFKAKMTTWTDSLSNKLLEFKVNLTQGWTGSLAKLLGIESIASKLELKLPKITIKWQTKNTILGDISLPTGFDVKWNAKGAILNGAQIFGMAGNTFLGGGEAGREAVLPLDRNTGWMDKIADRVVSKISTGGAGDQSLVIYLTLDGKVVTKTVIKNINAQAKATGKNPLAAYI